MERREIKATDDRRETITRAARAGRRRAQMAPAGATQRSFETRDGAVAVVLRQLIINRAPDAPPVLVSQLDLCPSGFVEGRIELLAERGVEGAERLPAAARRLPADDAPAAQFHRLCLTDGYRYSPTARPTISSTSLTRNGLSR